MNYKIYALSICTLVMAACASTEDLSVSSRIPAARAKVKLNDGDNNNTKIKLSVEHMAAPAKVNEGATTYVVWTRPTQDAMAQNMGALSVDSGSRGEIETVSPLKEFEIFVTAEPSALVAQPTGESLLWKWVARK